MADEDVFEKYTKLCLVVKLISHSALGVFSQVAVTHSNRKRVFDQIYVR